MATPEDPSAKEPLGKGGGKLKKEEAHEKKGAREGNPLLKSQGSRGLEGGGRQRSSGGGGDHYHDFYYDDEDVVQYYYRYDDDDDHYHYQPFPMNILRRPLPNPWFDSVSEREEWELVLPWALRWTLLDLSADELRRFLRKLREIPLKEGFVRIPEEALQEADAWSLRDLLLDYYGAYAVEVAVEALRAAGCEDEAERLLLFIGETDSGFMEMPPHIQRTVRKKKAWSLEGVEITGHEIVCKGRKELLKIIEKDLAFFLRELCLGFILTWKEYWDFQKADKDSKEKSGKLLDMMQKIGEGICSWFLEEVERKYPGSFEILLAAVQGSGKKMAQASYHPEVQSESPLFTEEGRSKMENPAVRGESLLCHLCPCEELPETIRPEVFLDSEMSWERYRLCFTEAGSFLCLYTDVIFEVKGAVTITYHFDSWSKYLAKQNMEDWVVAGPLINIEADPAEAVAAVHFPHFLCLAGKYGSQVHIAHFGKGGISLEKPDRVGPYRVVLENPNFCSRGAIWKKPWSLFKHNIKVHTVALLYQMLRFQRPIFHLYLLPNDSSIRKAVHEHEVQCPSQRIEKPPWTQRPLRIGCRFFVETNDAKVCPKEVEFQYLDADKLQQYVELSAPQMQDMFNFSVMEKHKNELIWEAHVTQEELKSPEMTSSPPHSEQGASCHTLTNAASSSTDSGHGVESRK